MTKHEDTMFLKAIFLLPMLLGYGDALAEWRVRIFDRLEPDQVSETAPITIGGVAQTISISNTTPSAYAEFNCPNGRWPYSLQTRTGYYNQQGKLVFVSDQGSGTLNCIGNGDLELTWDNSLNPPFFTLQNYAIEKPQEPIEAPSQTYIPQCRLERRMTASYTNSAGNWSLVTVCD